MRPVTSDCGRVSSPVSESAAALADGTIDGGILSVGFPASAVLEVTTRAPHD
jgi:TRAP-type uncharacterized transport system substrate-binding protein